ncbi:bifunctional 2-polyprenyl-6-hydroxyphenol methylase/3-demethylubiquinol 3-O-methyltransferase UbiG [Streptomyces sp. PSKA30]|uniref:class I SAM-dependent methyltransferase n=1 Tax=Streptomyces sp. PSKA30 TaxID=2874597 RepID=UPI001CD08ED9|nr:methyltransferase domain-containing protein [Streptomyces sp. PSKA30]MBZ9640905.1 class I SAM-dependent methyltransferase [Streptomyces sp. PSKA30]
MLRECTVRAGTDVARALDVGCNVGGLSYALSEWVGDQVVGVDISPRAVDVAKAVARNRGGTFHVAEQGPFTREVRIRLNRAASRADLAYEVRDAERLRGFAIGFDAVVLSNVLDRVNDPTAYLGQFLDSADVLRSGGLLMVACPWSWEPRFSHPDAWLGSAGGQGPQRPRPEGDPQVRLRARRGGGPAWCAPAEPA